MIRAHGGRTDELADQLLPDDSQVRRSAQRRIADRIPVVTRLGRKRSRHRVEVGSKRGPIAVPEKRWLEV